jgi:release factor glutamine methyltransferase
MRGRGRIANRASVSSALADWLWEGAARLSTVSDTPRLDAELIAAHALGLSRADMLLRLRDLAVPEGAEALLQRRLAHEPVAHLTGSRDFWTLTLKVTPDVLIPRPDSETLIEAAIDHFRDRPPPRRILDLGTGSGALLLAALDVWPQASGVGVDISPAALAIARENAGACDMAGRAEFRIGDWCEGLEWEGFDLVLSNPPYIKKSASLDAQVLCEPEMALFGGADGLDAYRVLARQLPGFNDSLLLAAIEIGWDQRETAAALFAKAGFTVAIRSDLAGHPRCLVLTSPGNGG